MIIVVIVDNYNRMSCLNVVNAICNEYKLNLQLEKEG